MDERSTHRTGLPEFVLARLAEIDPYRGGLWDALPHHPYCAGMTVDDYDGYEFRGELCDCGWPQRVVAWCAAARALVELHTGHHECVGDRHGRRGTVLVAVGYIHENDPTLLLLAQIWADHPDFDPRWSRH